MYVYCLYYYGNIQLTYISIIAITQVVLTPPTKTADRFSVQITFMFLILFPILWLAQFKTECQYTSISAHYLQ